MTLSTRAEHAFGEEVDLVSDEVESHVSPEGEAEEYVMSVEGTEDDPVEIDDPKARARDVADEVGETAVDWAGCYTDSKSVAESVGEAFADRAYEEVIEAFRTIPTIEVVGR